jgi:hypothetical protein
MYDGAGQHVFFAHKFTGKERDSAGGRPLTDGHEGGAAPFGFKGGWHTLGAWQSIGWPTLCEFVFCKGWAVLRFVFPPWKPFTPPLIRVFHLAVFPSLLSQTSRSYLINGFVARKPQNRRGGNSRKVMIWLSLKRFVL